MKKYYRTDLIKQFMKENNWGVLKFCVECGISTQAYYKIMHQQLKCRISTIFKIANVMSVAMNELHY